MRKEKQDKDNERATLLVDGWSMTTCTPSVLSVSLVKTLRLLRSMLVGAKPLKQLAGPTTAKPTRTVVSLRRAKIP